jgi:hypothetical protein
VLLVGAQVGNTGTKFSQTDNAPSLSPQVACFQNAQPFPHYLRRSPAQFPDQHQQPSSRSVVEPCLNCSTHCFIVLQIANRRTHVVQQQRGRSEARQYSLLRSSSGPSFLLWRLSRTEALFCSCVQLSRNNRHGNLRRDHRPPTAKTRFTLPCSRLNFRGVPGRCLFAAFSTDDASTPLLAITYLQALCFHAITKSFARRRYGKLFSFNPLRTLSIAMGVVRQSVFCEGPMRPSTVVYRSQCVAATTLASNCGRRRPQHSARICSCVLNNLQHWRAFPSLLLHPRLRDCIQLGCCLSRSIRAALRPRPRGCRTLFSS